MMKKKSIIGVVIAIAAMATFSFRYFNNHYKESKKSSTLYFTGYVLGKVKSCGCSLQDLGGLARRLTYMSRIPRDESLVVDFGSYFTDPNTSTDKAKVAFYVEQSKAAPYDVINLVEDDAKVLDKEVLGEFKFSNLFSTDPAVVKSAFIQKAGIQYWVTGIDKAKGAFPAAELMSNISNLGKDVLPVILSNYTMAENISFLESHKERPLIIIGHDLVFSEFFSKEVVPSLYMTGGDRGRHVVKSSLELTFQGSVLSAVRLADWTMVGLANSLDEGPVAEKVLKDTLAWEKKHGEIVEH